MKYEISPDRLKLVLIADQNDIKALKEIENIDTDSSMFDFLESLTRNSELNWINPEDSGDLTDGPILGLLGEPTTEKTGRFIGTWPDKNQVLAPHYEPILERWGWMNYQVKSLLRELLENGQATLISP